jgi:hypothetical protein
MAVTGGILLLVNVSVNSNVVNGGIGSGPTHLTSTQGETGAEPAGDLLRDQRKHWTAAAGVGRVAAALPEEIGERSGERREDLLAPHAQHFPQLRQALANLEDEDLRRKASGETERHMYAERERIAEGSWQGWQEIAGVSSG